MAESANFANGGLSLPTTKRFRDCVCRDQDNEVDDPMLKFSFDEHIFVGEHQHEAVCKEGAAVTV